MPAWPAAAGCAGASSSGAGASGGVSCALARSGMKIRMNNANNLFFIMDETHESALRPRRQGAAHLTHRVHTRFGIVAKKLRGKGGRKVGGVGRNFPLIPKCYRGGEAARRVLAF